MKTCFLPKRLSVLLFMPMFFPISLSLSPSKCVSFSCFACKWHLANGDWLLLLPECLSGDFDAVYGEKHASLSLIEATIAHWVRFMENRFRYRVNGKMLYISQDTYYLLPTETNRNHSFVSRTVVGRSIKHLQSKNVSRKLPDEMLK